MDKKRLTINMLANILGFAVNMGISFFLTPYLVSAVGKEAYGFVGLANNFVSYGQLATLTLNSMVGRFITIAYYREDKQRVNEYFTSVAIINIVMASIMFIPLMIIIYFLEDLVNISEGIIWDVKILWLLLFIAFLLNTGTSIFAIATFLKNRIDLASIRDIIANILKVIVLVSSFAFFKPCIWYIGGATLLVAIITGTYNIYLHKKMLKKIRIRRKYFSLNALKEISLAGIWNLVIKLGQILTDGLDLLISNIFISAGAMGNLSIAKTVSMAVNSLIGTIVSVFLPQITIEYAKENTSLVLNHIKKSMKITGLFTNIALGFTIAFGYMFYSLWVPGEDIRLIQIVSILSTYSIIVGGVINPLFSVFTITNKVKVNAIVIVSLGIINTLIVLFLLRYTTLGILAVAGVSSTTAIIKNITFTPMYAARCLNVDSRTFYPIIFRYSICSLVLIGIFVVIQGMLECSWASFITGGIICSVIGCIINYIGLLDKEERIWLWNIARKAAKKIKGE